MKKYLVLLVTIASTQLFAHVESISTEQRFHEATASGVVVVDFYATWCGPCKKLAPVLDKLSDEMSGVSFIKVDSDQVSVGRSLGVSGLPTVILYKDGKEMSRFAGYKDESSVRAFINNAK